MDTIVRRAWCKLPHKKASHRRIKRPCQNQLERGDSPNVIASVFGVNPALLLSS